MRRGASNLRAEAEAEWVATIKEKALNNQRFLTECTPGYYNNEGKPEEGTGLCWRAIRRRTGRVPRNHSQVACRWRDEGSAIQLSPHRIRGWHTQFRGALGRLAEADIASASLQFGLAERFRRAAPGNLISAKILSGSQKGHPSA